MSQAQKPKGSDWTRLLTDPDLVTHLGTLLQTYREVPPDKREMALLEVMRKIKEDAARSRQEHESVSAVHAPQPKNGSGESAAFAPKTSVGIPVPEPVTVAPPFEPDLFTPAPDSDRRRHNRLKCYFAVEIDVEGVERPIWGNLANVSRGGCMVETAEPVPAGKDLQIGLWVASGKLWVKGVIISGMATRTTSSYGVRVKFSEPELSEKEHVREFLKFIETTIRKSHNGKSYVTQLKK